MKRRAAVVCALILACHSPGEERRTADEIALRDKFITTLAESEDAGRAVTLLSRSDLRFEDGFGDLLFDPPGNVRNKALRNVGRRAHLMLRRHGDTRMHLVVGGWANVKAIGTRPVFSVRLNGSIIASDVVTEEGGMGTNVLVTADRFEGAEWADVYIELSSVGFFQSEPPALTVALVTDVTWTEAP